MNVPGVEVLALEFPVHHTHPLPLCRSTDSGFRPAEPRALPTTIKKESSYAKLPFHL